MAAYYTVVQYVPDPVIGERVNIGVIVASEGRLRARFLDNWRRVRRFGGEDIEFLLDFARRMQEATALQPRLPQFQQTPRLDEAFFRDMIGSWINSIQFTEPRASLEDPDSLLEDVSSRFLREPERGRHRERCEEVMPELVESPGDGGDLYAALERIADAARALIACERRATTEAYCDDEWAVLEAALAALNRGAGR